MHSERHGLRSVIAPVWFLSPLILIQAPLPSLSTIFEAYRNNTVLIGSRDLVPGASAHLNSHNLKYPSLFFKALPTPPSTTVVLEIRRGNLRLLRRHVRIDNQSILLRWQSAPLIGISVKGRSRPSSIVFLCEVKMTSASQKPISFHPTPTPSR